MSPGEVVPALPIPPAAQLMVAAVLGLIWGSFANVCIHRLPEGRSVVWPGSACPRCGRSIAWYDNVPVLSWLLLRGRCRSCRAGIPAQYPLVEALCGALALALCAQHGLSWRWAALSWMAISIVILVPIDRRHGILPDRVTLPGIAAGLALSFPSQEPTPFGALRGALVGGLVPLGVRSLYMAYAHVRDRRRPTLAEGPAADPVVPAATAAIVPGGAPADLQGGAAEADALLDAGETDDQAPQREGMGLGDVKMLAMVGAFLGAPLVLLVMLLGSIIGSLYVLPLLATGRHGMKTPLPFGPFLGVAALVAAFWGEDILRWYIGLLLPGMG
jgi:leader peptidase (prepilin peptidase) / N-methyltransferase